MIGLAISTGWAQSDDQLPDFRSDGFTPPVHIPPRIPLNDPGLPQTLNGRFNATQQIRSNSAAGTLANLSDQQNSNGRSLQSYGPGHPQNQNRRGSGFQERIANMFAGGDQRNLSRTPSAGNTNSQRRVQTAVVEQRRSQHPSRNLPPFRTIQTDRIQEVLANTVGSFSSQKHSPRHRSQPFVTSRTHRQRDRVALNRQTPNQAERIPYYNRPDQKTLPTTNLTPTENRQIQTASVQEVDRQKNEFVSSTEFESAESTPAKNNGSLSIRTAQQFQLPNSDRSTGNQKAVSVLRNSPNDDIVLNPPDSDFESEFELTTPESLNLDETNDGDSNDSFVVDSDLDSPRQSNFAPRQSNILRSSSPLQEEELGSDLNQDETNQMESPLDQDTQPRESNPLRRSCDEFRDQLLNSPITDIALDLSPPGKTDLFGPNRVRTWRDTYGNELASGTIADLRRGYVIVDTNDGGQVRLPYARLSDADWQAISEHWKLPVECGLGSETFVERCWAPQTATWYASSLCHKPLYFENIQLERYGHSHGPFLQPVASTAHFFGKLFFLPYNTAINPPNECQYALGFYRPGNCAPWLRDPFPFSLAGAVRQGSIYTGIGLLAD